MRITPNEVKQKRNTIAPAAASDGASSGSVIVRNRRIGPAPSVEPTSQRRPSSVPQNEPTTRTTTARLKKTCAARIAQIVWSSDGGSTSTNAVATTSVGRTNGTSTASSSAVRPRNVKRESAQASGRPAVIVTTVDTAACQNVNQTIEPVERLSTTSTGTSSPPSTTSPRRRIATSGTTKKIAENASAGAASAAVVPSERRCLSTLAPIHPAPLRSRHSGVTAGSPGRSRAS